MEQSIAVATHDVQIFNSKNKPKHGHSSNLVQELDELQNIQAAHHLME